MIDLKKISLDEEMFHWTDKCKQPIALRNFRPTVVGYWTPGTKIIEVQESKHFCLTFPPPPNQQAFAGLCSYLKMQLLINNAAAYLYLGLQKIKGSQETDKGLIVLGDNGTEKKCFVTPFKSDAQGTEFLDTVTTDPENFFPWDSLLPTGKEKVPNLDVTMRDLYSHLLLQKELSEDGREVREFFRKKQETNIFEGVGSQEILEVCNLYLASRMQEGADNAPSRPILRSIGDPNG